MNVDMAARLVGGLLAGVGGWRMADMVTTTDNASGMHWGMALGLTALGLLLTPYILIRPLNWLCEQFTPLPTHDLLAGALGLLLGLLAGALVAVPLSMLPDMAGRFLPSLAALAFAYLGIKVMYERKDDLLALLPAHKSSAHGIIPSDLANSKNALYPANSTSGNSNGANTNIFSPGVPKVILDTSSIIDGRVADISQTGFIGGAMIIPRFVLNELQHIADSSDILRRNRGRRGLDILNRLQKESATPIYIYDADYEDVPQVDAKLVKMAKQLYCPIVTQDFNLNRVAELQGVKVLNINELANAVKSVVLPGEEMTVKIIQEGKELGQGVGYLDDGTMVVVEGGRRWISHEIEIVVTRVLQTVAGRMIFAHPKTE